MCRAVKSTPRAGSYNMHPTTTLDIRLVPKLLYTLVTSSAKKYKTFPVLVHLISSAIKPYKSILQMLRLTFTRVTYGKWFASLVDGASNFGDFKSASMGFYAKLLPANQVVVTWGE